MYKATCPNCGYISQWLPKPQTVEVECGFCKNTVEMRFKAVDPLPVKPPELTECGPIQGQCPNCEREYYYPSVEPMQLIECPCGTRLNPRAECTGDTKGPQPKHFCVNCGSVKIRIHIPPESMFLSNQLRRIYCKDCNWLGPMGEGVGGAFKELGALCEVSGCPTKAKVIELDYFEAKGKCTNFNGIFNRKLDSEGKPIGFPPGCWKSVDENSYQVPMTTTELEILIIHCGKCGEDKEVPRDFMDRGGHYLCSTCSIKIEYKPAKEVVEATPQKFGELYAYDPKEIRYRCESCLHFLTVPRNTPEDEYKCPKCQTVATSKDIIGCGRGMTLGEDKETPPEPEAEYQCFGEGHEYDEKRIQYRCPNCASFLQVLRDELRGDLKCPKCNMISTSKAIVRSGVTTAINELKLEPDEPPLVSDIPKGYIQCLCPECKDPVYIVEEAPTWGVRQCASRLEWCPKCGKQWTFKELLAGGYLKPLRLGRNAIVKEVTLKRELFDEIKEPKKMDKVLTPTPTPLERFKTACRRMNGIEYKIRKAEGEIGTKTTAIKILVVEIKQLEGDLVVASKEVVALEKELGSL